MTILNSRVDGLQGIAIGDYKNASLKATIESNWEGLKTEREFANWPKNKKRKQRVEQRNNLRSEQKIFEGYRETATETNNCEIPTTWARSSCSYATTHKCKWEGKILFLHSYWLISRMSPDTQTCTTICKHADQWWSTYPFGPTGNG